MTDSPRPTVVDVRELRRVEGRTAGRGLHDYRAVFAHTVVVGTSARQGVGAPRELIGGLDDRATVAGSVPLLG